MKTKLILDITKSQQAQLNAVVTGRQGDKGTVTVNVFVVDGGVPYNLTGQDIYYEGLKPNNAYVRDISGVKMINAAQGNFEYTFRPETFGVAGIGKRSYFSIEQGGTVRASTQDFGLVTLADAMTGNTMSGPYISELEELINLAQWLVDDINSRWTSINDQLTQLQNKLNGMDVVKRSGDTMIGDLRMQNGKAIRFRNAADNNTPLYMGASSNGNFNMWSDVASKTVVTYVPSTDTFDILANNTNLLKKAGGTMTGTVRFAHAFSQILQSDSGKKAWVVHHPDSNSIMFAPETSPDSGAWDWAKAIEFKDDGTIKQAKDGRVTLTLTADARAFDGGVGQIADRIGNSVTLRLAIARGPGVPTSAVMTTLPVNYRPLLSLYQGIIATDGTVGRLFIAPNGEVKIDVGPDSRNYYITITYLVN
ncbi:BppU family phage baseplate upper protein [Bacillus cereus]|uniref:BppU family phage baseplate upper protein n=1 Tax=Bacillus cereus TaxID=1396 RepID=UPI002406302E|nr:BppU family phage baseplate upper protein [Bacillus cereus]MCU5709217.1 phage baseplate upper protein [Bacillus cereus]MDF9630563.1 BppU family phage baseplate upper protein [Bacillus cereus]MDG1585415.1 BppU family phage baseplate upper protein [Bacillus cereus]MDG1633991.1 BppU family phage baseplate upper protein [Bacillus cereus]MEC2498424.1 BppU family phage baseplate upper protein [Bacillus cereus]